MAACGEAAVAVAVCGSKRGDDHGSRRLERDVVCQSAVATTNAECHAGLR